MGSGLVWHQGMVGQHYFAEWSGVTFAIRKNKDGMWEFWMSSEDYVPIEDRPQFADGPIEELKLRAVHMVLASVRANLDELETQLAKDRANGQSKE